MNAEDKADLEALIVGFLTSSLKENPQGFTIQEFERLFPAGADEPHDWYKRYGKSNPLDALRCIPQSVRISDNGQWGTIYVSLIRRSDKVDQHLVDLVTHQRASNKKRRPGPRSSSQRVLDSFAINKKYSHGPSRLKVQGSLNVDRGEPAWDYRRRGSPVTNDYRAARPSYHKDPVRAPPNDSRNRPFQQPVIPLQVAKPSQSPPQQNYFSSLQSQNRCSSSVPTKALTPAKVTPAPSLTSAHPPTPLKPNDRPVDKPIDSEEVQEKKSIVLQRLIQLLTKKASEFNIFYLDGVYKLEYEEKLDPSELGYCSITSLLEDSYFSAFIQINFKRNSHTVSMRNLYNGKENASKPSSGSDFITSAQSATCNDPLADRSNKARSVAGKYEALDPFNLRTMLSNIEAMSDIKEIPLGNNKVEDIIKYRTMRIIFKDPNLTLKLDDWDMRYQQEWNRGKVQIRDYGFKTLLDFFKHLAIELPIAITLTRNDEWVASSDYDKIGRWITNKVKSGQYRAVIVLNSFFERVALPNDKYTYADLKGLNESDYVAANIMSVKAPHKMWIQLRTHKRIEEHLNLEGSLSGYDDIKKRFYIPDGFIRPGFPCVAFDESQQRWCRAVILKVAETGHRDEPVVAFLVDCGVTRCLPSSHLTCLQKVHLKVPVGLIYAELHGVEDDLAPIAKRVLQEFTSPPVTLACKIKGSIELKEDRGDDYLPNRCYSVTLIDTTQATDVDLAKYINSCQKSPDEYSST